MRRQLRSRRALAFPYGYRYRLDDQDEVNQNYLADEEEEAEEEARVMVVPNLEKEEEEEEEKGEEEEKKEEEEGQGQPTGNAWWRKLQILNEYLWDPERRMSLARTGHQRLPRGLSSNLPSAVLKTPLPCNLVHGHHLLSKPFQRRCCKGLILVIYFFFYASLAAVITLCMYTLFLTISPYMPTFNEQMKPPGVMIRPFAHSLNFNFNVSEPDTWQHYVISLNGFLQGYNDSLQEEMNVDCPPGQYFIQDGDEDADKKACQFKRSSLKNCSGLEDPTFGYSTGQPCILLKMNRIVGFRPELGDPVKVSCKVQTGDENDIRSINYYPESASFDLRYYPYYGKLTHVNYTSPLVAMHFTDVVKNQAVPVQCQLKGKGITNDVISDRFVGRVIFTLNIET
ncbi:protein ATP1B4 isoform X2 [Cynocephalus volans]|uniref:protein ATP1B4 isoform X2 n=1 Tax=Cynocephalus volans TaxID=110931 RepID=UPI002FC8FD19